MNLAWNILTTFTARVAVLALALCSSIIIARSLGPEGLGLLSLIILLPDLAKTFGLLGFDQANAVYAGLEPGNRRALVWQSTIMAVVIGGLSTVAGICYLVIGAPGSQIFVRGPLWLYLLALLSVPAGLINAYWGAILRGMNRIFLLNGVEVGTKVVGVTLVIAIVWWLHFGLAGLIWANFVIDAGTVVLLAVLLKDSGAWGRPVLDWSLWKRTGNLAMLAYTGGILSYLNYRVDIFIIAALLPTEQLGFYAIAVGLAERLWILTGAVGNALLPHLTNSQDRDPAVAAVVARHVMVWTGVACLLVFGLADLVVRLLYSSKFAQTVAPLRWLLPGIFTLTLAKVVVSELMARKKLGYLVWVASVAATVNIVGNLVLVPRMGISGAALASSISYTVLSFMVTRYYLRETGVSWTTLVPRLSDLQAYNAVWLQFREKLGVFFLKPSVIKKR